MPKSVAVYFDAPGVMDYPFNEGYFEPYKDLAARCLKEGLDFYVTRDDAYHGEMTFAKAWRFEGETLVEVTGPLKVDLIYIKGQNILTQLGPNDRSINHPELEQFANNKMLTYET